MTPEQYAVQQAAISAAITRFVLSFGTLFTRPALSVAEWLGFLRLLYPEVSRQRDASAEIARQFYDSEREKYVPDLPTNARLLEPYEFDWFVKSMDPVRESMSREGSPESALAATALRVVREVENAGRRQIIHAVREDQQLEQKIAEGGEPVRQKMTLPPELKRELLDILAGGETSERVTWGGQTVEQIKDTPVERAALVKGWARVATGRETCAWCLMLVSRGPVYEGAESAGLDLPDEVAAKMFGDADMEDYYADITGYMDEWHVGCDCKVVPVFDVMNWVGREASQRAYSLWRKAVEKADDALEADPDKEYYSQKKGYWLPTTRNREAINQLRKMLASGEIDSQEWAALTAA